MTRTRALSSSLRKQLELAVLAARRESESAARAAAEGLGVFSDRRPEHLDSRQATLRNGLRAKLRQLGGDTELLVEECAYEQWHRLLFARFLAENDLLLHPQYKAPVSLQDCEDLASSLGEPDGWSVAARFAAEILPGIFRLDDPCVELRIAPEGRHALEHVLNSLPPAVFEADDSLGWVYQFWQKGKKDEVNASERKIGGADLGPVTQLFTENYMVRFLLENTLGAWWASRHPESPLVEEFEYMRIDERGEPAAGSFEDWPESIADVTVMDPCCGSGHFLVEAFSMLWRMRAEEEQVTAVAAQDSVIRSNLFGLELDPRCVQIAMFAIAFQAWKEGGGWRQLPTPEIACSGISVKASAEEWKALAHDDAILEAAIGRLHALFADAETLGSLISPVRATENAGLESVDWKDVAPLVRQALGAESELAPQQIRHVFSGATVDLARAADLLSRTYSLVATNPPYLGLGRQSSVLEATTTTEYHDARHELALTFVARSLESIGNSGSLAVVLPSEWTHARSGRSFRSWALANLHIPLVATLGVDSFTTPLRVAPLLIVCRRGTPSPGLQVIDVSTSELDEKPRALRETPLRELSVEYWRSAPDDRLLLQGEYAASTVGFLGDVADCRAGISAGDSQRFERFFWEVSLEESRWALLQSSPETEWAPDSGQNRVVLWEDESGQIAALAESVRHLNHIAQNWRRGKPLWGKQGVIVSQIGAKSTMYWGEIFDSTCFAIVPTIPENLGAVVAFAESGELKRSIGQISPTWKLGSPKTVLQVPFDLAYWSSVAAETFPLGLPEKSSDDPTQWSFHGAVAECEAPLQVAVSRLLGYSWPNQKPDAADSFVDGDGIVCLPSVAGESTAAERVRALLAASFGDSWSSALLDAHLAAAEGKVGDLEGWLRDKFFGNHCRTFSNRPFVWHIWDGRRDGFSAFVNYQLLNRKTLEKLTYTYLGQDWVERQRAESLDETPGADARLLAALKLRQKLEAILEGEKPYDIYSRWKTVDKQPIGWDPDLDDGVRVNIRPFVKAGVLRTPVSVHWRKDRGANPDGTVRHNDIHLSLAEKLEARKRVGSA